MVLIDGSFGEGGGQIVRSALALSIVMGIPFEIDNIRANRDKKGLSYQHIAAIEGARKICNAEISGVYFGSDHMIFSPGKTRSGRYRFNIGTAGSTLLVLQTIYLPLSLINSRSSITITGGTHVPWAPCYNYVELHWLKLLNDIGFNMSVELESAGYYPKGDGKINAIIRPALKIKNINLCNRGKLEAIYGISGVSNLDHSIGYRQRKRALSNLVEYSRISKIRVTEIPSKYKGTILILVGKFTNSQCCYFSLGEIGKPAEVVADEATEAFVKFLSTDGVIDEYLADQLLLPLSLANEESIFKTNRITNHLITNSEIIRLFTNTKIIINGNPGEAGIIKITPNHSA